MSIDDDWAKFEPTESIEIMMSTRDLGVLCNAAVLNGVSLQDFIFLAAWDAANETLSTARDDEAACGGYNSYEELEAALPLSNIKQFESVD